MMSQIDAWVATAAKQKLVRRQIDLGPLGDEEVEVQVEHCGLCHSDLSMLANDWGWFRFPAVFGHEAVGTVVEVGRAAKGVKVGQMVGVGWTAESCMHCRRCLSGEHHMCAEALPTIVEHRGGFASRVRPHWAWALPIPEALDASEAGPLLCGGVTVFTPLAAFARPTSRVGVVGIGGLGHLAVTFAAAFGCEVTAFTSEGKFEEARGFGAHHVVSSREPGAIKKLAGTFDLILVTASARLDRESLLGALAPNGRLHVVGAVLEPIQVGAFSLIAGQKSLSGSPVGSPVGTATMLDFAARHRITPQTEHFPMSRINEAFERLEAGRARYRIILEADF
jgi:uncharacterized zinc-type alcohol dehydrogenase-like protein